MKTQENMSQTKEQNKSPKTVPNKTEINDLPHREFKIAVIKLFNEIGRTMHEQSETVNKETRSTKQKSWSRRILKILPEEFNSRCRRKDQ